MPARVAGVKGQKYTEKLMNLFQEYEKQQNWRDWECYLKFIAYSHEDSVVDLGCSKHSKRKEVLTCDL